MSSNLGRFDRLVRWLLALAAFAAAAVMLEQTTPKVVAFAAGVFCLYEAIFATCGAMALAGKTSIKKPLSAEALYLLTLNGLQAVLAYVWFTAGLEKVVNSAFVDGMSKTLSAFASQNPYAWYKTVLLGPAMDNAALLGIVVQWAEVGVAVIMVGAIVVSFCGRSRQLLSGARGFLILALLLGMAMNASFFFAAGWLSPSTHTVNLMMFWVQAVLLYMHSVVLIDRIKT